MSRGQKGAPAVEPTGGWIRKPSPPQIASSGRRAPDQDDAGGASYDVTVPPFPDGLARESRPQLRQDGPVLGGTEGHGGRAGEHRKKPNERTRAVGDGRHGE